jgi:hypothetical protein
MVRPAAQSKRPPETSRLSGTSRRQISPLRDAGWLLNRGNWLTEASFDIPVSGRYLKCASPLGGDWSYPLGKADRRLPPVVGPPVHKGRLPR